VLAASNTNGSEGDGEALFLTASRVEMSVLWVWLVVLWWGGKVSGCLLLL
jgi:hypothetical protein